MNNLFLKTIIIILIVCSSLLSSENNNPLLVGSEDDNNKQVYLIWFSPEQSWGKDIWSNLLVLKKTLEAYGYNFEILVGSFTSTNFKSIQNRIIEPNWVTIMDNASTFNYFSNLEVVGVYGHGMGMQGNPSNGLVIGYYLPPTTGQLDTRFKVLNDLMNTSLYQYVYSWPDPLKLDYLEC